MSTPAPTAPRMSMRRLAKWIRACEDAWPTPPGDDPVAAMTIDRMRRDRRKIIVAVRRDVLPIVGANGQYSEAMHREAVRRWWNKRVLDVRGSISGGGGLTMPRRPKAVRAGTVATMVLQTRVTPVERAFIAERANAAGLSASDYLRAAAGLLKLPDAKPLVMSIPAGDPELRRLGGLLNQAIRALHIANKYNKSELIPRAVALCGQCAAHIEAKIKASP